MCCSVSVDTLRYRFEEGISHWRDTTVYGTYLLTQRRTAATPTSVSLLLNHDSARRPWWPSMITEHFGRYLSCVQRTVQEKDFEVILAVKMETRHHTFGREFIAFVIIAELWQPEVARPGNFVSNFCVFLEKRSLSNCRYCADRAQNLPGPAPHIWLTLFQISSKLVHFWDVSAELMPNAWRPFLLRTVFTI